MSLTTELFFVLSIIVLGGLFSFLSFAIFQLSATTRRLEADVEKTLWEIEAKAAERCQTMADQASDRAASQASRGDDLTRAAADIRFQSREEVRARLEILQHHATATDAGAAYALDRVTRALSPTVKVVGDTKIVVASVALGDTYVEAVRPCIASHEAYARRMGYGYALLDRPPANIPRPVSWLKVPLIAGLFEGGYEYVFCIDADALVTNADMRLEPLIAKLHESGACLSLAEDEAGINCGIMLLRNSRETMALLDLVWMNDVDLAHPLWEQNALKILMETYSEVRRHVLIEPDPKTFNSFPPERGDFHPTAARNTWSAGDLICHFSGIRPPHLQRLIARYVEELSRTEVA